MNRRMVLPLIVIGTACFAQPLQAATATVASNIAFADPLRVSTSSEINLPVLITINNYGSSWVGRPDQAHDVIAFTGPDNQLMNFLTRTRSEGDNNPGTVVPIKSICSVNGKDEGCADIYGSLKSDAKSLYAGMDTLYLSELAPSASENSRLTAFDLYAVYQ